MKTLIFKSLLLIAIAIGVANYVVYLNTGRGFIDEVPKLDLSSYLPNKNSVEKAMPRLPSGEEQVYKWVDDNGRVHYSTNKAEADVGSQAVDVDSTLTLVESQTPPIRLDNQPGSSSKPSSELKPSDVYDLDAVEKLIEDARAVQDLVDERTRQID